MNNLFTKEEKNKLVNYILAFKLGNQVFPKILTDAYGNRIDLENFRINLINNRLQGEIDLVNFCSTVFSDFIPQYPVIITDLSLWANCLNYNYNSQYYKRRFFMLDGYSPKYNIAIEADYDSTHDPIYDNARDLYVLRANNISTLRIKNYGYLDNIESENTIIKFKKRMPKWINSAVDYSDITIYTWLTQFLGLYEILESIAQNIQPRFNKTTFMYYKNLCKIIGRN
jgi:hypothetical protein